MGLFGKKFDFDKFQAGITAAQASLAGDYGSAAHAWGGYAKGKKDRERQTLLDAAINADDTLPSQAKQYARLYPEAYVSSYLRSLHSARPSGGTGSSDAGLSSAPPSGQIGTLDLGSGGAGLSEQQRFISRSSLDGHGRSGDGVGPAVLSDRDILEHDAGVGVGHRRAPGFFGRRFTRPW